MHPAATVAAALELSADGLDDGEIGRRLGVSRRTVNDWTRGTLPRSYLGLGRPVCARCGTEAHRFDELSTSYAYLLGLYLGDGMISPGPRGVHRLRIFLDMRHPAILEECEAAIGAVLPGQRPGCQRRRSWFEIYSYSKAWSCLLPQHGPGTKHSRRIWLRSWQSELVALAPQLLLRGLIHSDGCRFVNTGRDGWRFSRYSFTNRSSDIREIFCRACDLLGLAWTETKDKIYVSRKADVELLDRHVGPKR